MIKKEDILKYIGCYPDGSSKSELEINIMCINKSTETQEIIDNVLSMDALLNIHTGEQYTTLTALFQDDSHTDLCHCYNLLNRFHDSNNSYDESAITYTILNVAVIPKSKNEYHFITGHPFIWFACSSKIDGKINTLKITFKNDSIFIL